MNNVYGYGCISSVHISRKDTERIKQTRAYQALKAQFDNMMLSEDALYVDLVTASYRKRHKLNWILDSAGYGDCIVITAISALGTSVEEITENYKKIYERNIGLLFPDYSNTETSLNPLSTCDWSMVISDELKYNGIEYSQGIKDRIELIKDVKIKTFRGREFYEKPENFETVYWLYENYFIAEKDTYKNNLINISKKFFVRLAAEYEMDEENYLKALREQEEKYNISKKPKRFGAVPDNFEEFLKLIDSGVPLNEAAKQMNYYSMDEINFSRFKIKYYGGKKSMAVANELRKTPLALSLTNGILGPHVDK